MLNTSHKHHSHTQLHSTSHTQHISTHTHHKSSHSYTNFTHYTPQHAQTSPIHKRHQALQHASSTHWDCLIIGGGSSGLGIALDCATRGYKTLLLEQADFAKGTSSRSTKLLHGGVRYLAQGDIPLVYEALHERDTIISNAPHLCKKQEFIIPSATLLGTLYYASGLYLYGALAGSMSLGKTSFLRKSEIRKRLHGIKEQWLDSGVSYTDGQFDDARLAISLMLSIEAHGGMALNYLRVTHFIKNTKGHITGVLADDMHPHISQRTQETFTIHASCIFNATGVFTNALNRLDNPNDSSLDVRYSQGIHLVLEREFLPNDCALMIPKTSDNRVLFAIPWHTKLLIGTTDTPIHQASLEPKALDEEITFILETFSRYASKTPKRSDVLSVFAGLRPLAAFTSATQATKSISRRHKIRITKSHIIYLNGGKWTTFRLAAQECVNTAIKHGLLASKPCKTKHLKLCDYAEDGDFNHHLCVYGSNASQILQLEQNNTQLSQKIHPRYPYTFAQVWWAITHEKALCIEDILARRIRLLFLDAQAAREAAEGVGAFMAGVLGWSPHVLAQEIQHFCTLTTHYQLASNPT